MLAEYLELYAFNRWAHRRTLGFVAELTPEQYERPVGGSFPSLRATMEHVFRAEVAWLARWLGERRGPSPELPPDTDLGKLAARWEGHWERQSAFLASLGESDLDRRLEITLWSGVEMEQRLGDTLRHVVNHATYHRGQVVTLARQLGGAAVGTDFITYCLLRDTGRL